MLRCSNGIQTSYFEVYMLKMIFCIEQLTHTFRNDMELQFYNAIKVGTNIVEFAIRSLSTMVYIKRVDSR